MILHVTRTWRPPAAEPAAAYEWCVGDGGVGEDVTRDA